MQALRRVAALASRPATIRSALPFALVLGGWVAADLNPDVASDPPSGFVLFSRVSTWACVALCVLGSCAGLSRGIAGVPERIAAPACRFALPGLTVVAGLIAVRAILAPPAPTAADYITALVPPSGFPVHHGSAATRLVEDSRVLDLSELVDRDTARVQREVSPERTVTVERWRDGFRFSGPGGSPFAWLAPAPGNVVSLHRIGDTWIAVTDANETRPLHRYPFSGSLSRSRWVSALALLPRPLGAPSWIAGLLLVAALFGLVGWVLSRQARGHLARLERSVEATPTTGDEGTVREIVVVSTGEKVTLGSLPALPAGARFVFFEPATSSASYRADARPRPAWLAGSVVSRETAIQQARASVARRDAFALLLVALLATPAVVAAARGLTVSVGLFP